MLTNNKPKREVDDFWRALSLLQKNVNSQAASFIPNYDVTGANYDDDVHDDDDDEAAAAAVRLPRTRAPLQFRVASQMMVDEFPDYKQLVGPDQSYPHKARAARGDGDGGGGGASAVLTLVENQSYAAVVNGCQRLQLEEEACGAQVAAPATEDEASIVLERDDLIADYANLPLSAAPDAQELKRTPPVEYATVRLVPSSGCGATAAAGDTTARMSFNDSASDASFGARSCSTSSGGFSALRPVSARLEHLEASLASCQLESEQRKQPPGGSLLLNESRQRKSSLLKRFGSIVSGAFAAASISSQSSVTSKLSFAGSSSGNKAPDDRPASGMIPHDEQVGSNSSKGRVGLGSGVGGNNIATDSEISSSGISIANSNNNRKSALVIERTNVCDKTKQPSEQQQVDVADLIILPSKCNKKGNSNNQRKEKHQDLRAAKAQHNDVDHSDGRLSRSKNHSRNLKRTNLSSSVSSLFSTSASASNSSSADSSSTSATSTDSGHHRDLRPFKSSSLSEELESLMSRSGTADQDVLGPLQRRPSTHLSHRHHHRRLYHRHHHHQNHTRHHRRIEAQQQHQLSHRVEIDCNGKPAMASVATSGSRRSLLRLFSNQRATGASESSPNLTDSPSKSSASGELDLLDAPDAPVAAAEPISGIWNLSSLMDASHASASERFAAVNKISRKLRPIKSAKSWTLAASPVPEVETSGRESGDHESLNSSGGGRGAGIQPQLQLQHQQAAGCRLYSSLIYSTADDNSNNNDTNNRSHHQKHGKCQSLNLYQSLLRNYAKRRHRSSGGQQHNCSGGSAAGHHHHTHGHHRHHYRGHRASTRGHAHHSRCRLSSSAESLAGGGHSRCRESRPHVWGQLIKINNSDGSQVIELHRSPGRSWGFFVARGSINKSKGIFISRMHDSSANNALTGLLSIGDRILAIDDSPVEPDHDILRVNQLISKKSKILLKVKPFKG